MNYDVEMRSGAMICVPGFIKIGSGIRMLIGRGIHRHIDNKVISKGCFYFFKIRKAG
jgi:hypothetical protein